MKRCGECGEELFNLDKRCVRCGGTFFKAEPTPPSPLDPRIEAEVRRRHAADDSLRHERETVARTVRTMLNMAAGLTDRELEIALARLADALPRDPDSSDKPMAINTRIKGVVLTGYYQLRRTGAVCHEPKSRWRWYAKLGVLFEARDAFGERLINAIANHDLLLTNSEVADEWVATTPAAVRRLLD